MGRPIFARFIMSACAPKLFMVWLELLTPRLLMPKRGHGYFHTLVLIMGQTCIARIAG